MNKRQIALLVVIGGFVIFLIKAIAYYVSNSIALLSDAMESIVNIAASVMMFVALMIASIPEDTNHKYGHQRAENISALVEGVLIVVAAVLIIEAALGRILNPAPFGDIGEGLILSLGATSLNGLLSLLMWRESKRSHSMALEGDSKHLFSDVVSSVGVVIGLVIADLTGLFLLDPLMALVVAGLLVKMGIDLFRKTSRDLMDGKCDEEEKSIVAVLEGNNGYIEYHELKTRRSGSKVFMEVHICMNGDTSLSAAHDLSVKLENELMSAVPGIVPSIHIEDQAWCEKYRRDNP